MTSLFKDDPAVGDVHVSSAGGSKRKPRKKPSNVETTVDTGKSDFSFNVPISKVDDEQQIVYGWASVIEEGGAVVTDSQDDQIELHELAKAAHDFMKFHRVGGDMHETMGTGEIVESIVFTPDVQKALGVELNKVGWFIGYHVTSSEVWKRVKNGELVAFSFGGRAKRVAA